MKIQAVVAAIFLTAMLALAARAHAQSIGGSQGITAPQAISGGTGCNTSGTSILKGNGSGGCANASSGTDYAPATSGSSILKGNGSGGFISAVSGTDYQAPISNLQFAQAMWAMNAMANSGGL